MSIPTLDNLTCPYTQPTCDTLQSSTTHGPVFPFDNSYARLPERFFSRLSPTAVAEPRLVRLNENLALHLGLSPERLRAPEGVEVLAGNRVKISIIHAHQE